MARSKNPAAEKANDEKYRKPFRPVRLKRALADAVEARIVGLAQDFTQYVNDAVRMRLEAEGYWSPPPPPRKPPA